MIEHDARRVSECGIHVRLPAPNVTRVGTTDCPHCRALVRAARTEPLTSGPNAARRAAGKIGGKASKAGRGVRFGASPSDRSVAIRGKHGGVQ